ncbi:MAG TPA: lipase secretion chaperone [Noviherbaspirillum sp.]
MVEDKRESRLGKLGGATAGGLLLALLAIYIVLPERAEPVAGAPVHHVESGAPVRFGPGVWSDAPPIPSTVPEPAFADSDAPGGIVITADKRLVVNKALKDVADYFLLGGHAGTRATHMERLIAHLRASLPSPAFEEAAQIVRNYLQYLDTHDALLARTAPPPATPDSILPSADIERIGAWLAQRMRLRQDLLGMQVARIWFSEEESADQQLLAAMRQSGGNPPQQTATSEQASSESLQTLREKNAPIETQRAYVAVHFGEQAAQRFDAIEGKEQAWKARYATYRQTVENLRRQPGVDENERLRQIAALRTQTFATEQERLRAENLDALPAPR